MITNSGVFGQAAFSGWYTCFGRIMTHETGAATADTLSVCVDHPHPGVIYSL